MTPRLATLLCIALVLFIGVLLIVAQPAAPQQELGANIILSSGSPLSAPKGACYEEGQPCRQTTEEECFRNLDVDDLAAWHPGEECPDINQCNRVIGLTDTPDGFASKVPCSGTPEEWAELEQECAQELEEDFRTACQPAAQCKPIHLDGPLYDYSTQQYYPSVGPLQSPIPFTRCTVSCEAYLRCDQR